MSNAQRSATLRDVAAGLRVAAAMAHDNSEEDRAERLERDAGYVERAALELVETRVALARLYLAVRKTKLDRPSTLKELNDAKLQAKRALEVGNG